MRWYRGLLAVLSLTACNSILGNIEHYRIGAGGDASDDSDDGSQSGSGGTSVQGDVGDQGDQGDVGEAGGPAVATSCLDMACETPPIAKCQSDAQLQTYDPQGSCEAGICNYTDRLIDCDCKDDKCSGDACASVTCDKTPSARCKDDTTRIVFADGGDCEDGVCNYEQMDEVCEDDKKCLAADGGATCVACLSNEDCSGSKPVCNLTTNTCRAQPSCAGLAKSCGPDQDTDCCADSEVPGGSFNRLNDPAHTAKVSSFRLDKYEVTVGRFRKFFAEIGKFQLPEGAGKNANNPDDTGWDASRNQQFTRELGYIEEMQLNCRNDGGAKPTWTHAPGTSTETMPINCVGWSAAQAFCIWDGGRLPTDAEWNYAAAGGNANREYAWGDSAPDCDHANYQACLGGANGTVAIVGSTPEGDGLYGQSDLAGNVYEWVQDYWDQDKLPATCNDCATVHSDVAGRVVRGGSFFLPATKLANDLRLGLSEDTYRDDVGFRCAYAK